MIPPDLLDKIYRYCAYQDRCFSDVNARLRQWQVPPELAAKIMEELKEEKYLDEARYASSFARGRFVQKGWGPEKIRAALRAKKIPNEIISTALDEAGEEEIREKALQLAGKKWPTLKGTLQERKMKLVRFLAGKGYKMGVCWEIAGKFE